MKIALIGFDGISLFHLSIPIAIFHDALAVDSHPYDVRVCSENAKAIVTASGLVVSAQADWSFIGEADVVIFPSWSPGLSVSNVLKRNVQSAVDSDKMVVGLCVGAYALGYMGLLDGQRATSHWRYADDFKRQFPTVTFETNPLFIDSGNIITSAGSAASIDCCLYLMRRLRGHSIANQVARMMVAAPSRQGGQNQFIQQPIPERPKDNRLANFIDHVLHDLTQDFTLAYAAKQCAMSVRSFNRHFQHAYGIGFIQWLIHQRLNASLRLLEESTLSIAQVAEKSGFSSEQIFRKHFKSRFDTLPNQWRKLFTTPSLKKGPLL